MSKQQTKSTPKFMQTLDSTIYNQLSDLANAKGISVQELIRAVIIPEWLERRKST